eukprot:scaffold104_cov375-Prasinococcus_capsulatus_cf.AAC.15
MAYPCNCVHGLQIISLYHPANVAARTTTVAPPQAQMVSHPVYVSQAQPVYSQPGQAYHSSKPDAGASSSQPVTMV